jgi:twinkle protein
MAKVYHLPCSDCGSSDALADYGDHTFCYSCRMYRKIDGSVAETVDITGTLVPPVLLEHRTLTARGNISAGTCRRFGYGYHEGAHVAPYNDSAGTLVYQKLRTPDKRFSVLKAEDTSVQLKDLLFGRSVYGDVGGPALVITEGEIDCLTAAEALGSIGVHAVSVSCGAQGALECLKANFEFIDRYARVYLAFDNDEPGKKAVDAVVKSLGLTDIYIMSPPPEMKDLNDVFRAGGSRAVLDCYREAKRYRPSGILLADDIKQRVRNRPSFGTEWPWPTLNVQTYGINKNELIVITAGSGVGKTTCFKAIEGHLIGLGKRLGIIHLEEQERDTVLGLLTVAEGKPYHTPDSKILECEVNTKADALVDTGQLVLFDKSVGFDEETVMAAIRYMVIGLGCEFVFLDHITAIMDQYTCDVNQKARNFIVSLGKLVSALPFTLLAISHLRKADGKPAEEGGRVHLDDMLGASALKQWSHYVFALERNNQADSESERHMSLLRHLKNRPRGEFTGSVIPLVYDHKSCTMKEKPYATLPSSDSKFVGIGADDF